jgi:hypothetical protein
MHQIDPNRIPGWQLEGDIWVPSSVDTICPFCNHHSNLVTHSYSYHPHTRTVVMMGRCVRCGGQPKIWAIGVKTKGQQSGSECEEIWTLPKPSIRKISIPSDKLPPEIFDAYEEAVGCFNASF